MIDFHAILYVLLHGGPVHKAVVPRFLIYFMKTLIVIFFQLF